MVLDFQGVIPGYDKETYLIYEYPLTTTNRLKLTREVANLPRVDLSIDCVLEGQMGKVFVDHPEEPSAYMLQVGPMCYYAGKVGETGMRVMLQCLPANQLVMPSAPGWIEALKKTYGARLKVMDRYSFSGENLSTGHLKGLLASSEHSAEVKPMNLPITDEIWNQKHIVDLSTFDSSQDFQERGIGYYIEHGGSITGAAYSSLVCTRGIEVSVFVREGFRRHGVATALASYLLLHCKDQGLEANWDAANPESCKLALKLGYVPKGSYQAYYLRPG